MKQAIDITLLLIGVCVLPFLCLGVIAYFTVMALEEVADAGPTPTQ